MGICYYKLDDCTYPTWTLARYIQRLIALKCNERQLHRERDKRKGEKHDVDKWQKRVLYVKKIGPYQFG